MAKMWPGRIPQEILSNPMRSGECKTYKHLADELDDLFVVFYSRPWLGQKPSGEEIDGECDFIVAHPELGLLALEVKGGQIEYSPEQDRWMSQDRWGYTHLIKNPAYQAMQCKHQILTKLNKSRVWKSRRIFARHGVIFPDTERPCDDLTADMPLDIICFLDDFEKNFNTWIMQRFGDGVHSDTRTLPLGNDGIQALEYLLARPFQLHVPVGHILAEDDRTLQILTHQQYHILKAIEKIPRASISGGAGTGKTILAMEEAIRNAESGNKVLLTCYNRPLADEMKRKLSSYPAVTVGTFHELCNATAHKAGLSFPDNIPEKKLYSEVYPDYFNRALAVLPDFRFNTIIIDEGQDFHPVWLNVLEKALNKNGKGKIRVFFDSNQQVYGNTEKTLSEYKLVPILLSYNIRNTRTIHEMTQRYYRGYPVESIGPPGKKIDLFSLESLKILRRELENIISRLIIQERVNPADITVLMASSNLVHQICPDGFLAGKECALCDAPREKERIILDTVRRFKGLESPIVILVVTSDIINNVELLYVALSRARTHLIIMGEKENLAFIDRKS